MPITVAPATLIGLPPELLILIHDFLRPAAKLALKMSNRHLYLTFPPLASSKPSLHEPNPVALSSCARKAITSYYSFSKKRRGRKHCSYCHEWYPTNLFGDPWLTPLATETEEDKRMTENQISSQLVEDSTDHLGGPGIIDLPEGICNWHRGHLAQIISAPPPYPVHSPIQSRYPIQTSPVPALFPDLTSGWWCIPSLLCLHCKKIDSPLHVFAGREDVQESMTSFCARMALRGRCSWCDGCDTCGLVPVTRFVRISRESEASALESHKESGDGGFTEEPGRFVIYRREGAPWVREWKSRKFILYVRSQLPRHSAARRAVFDFSVAKTDFHGGIKHGPHRDVCVKLMQ